MREQDIRLAWPLANDEGKRGDTEAGTTPPGEGKPRPGGPPGGGSGK